MNSTQTQPDCRNEVPSEIKISFAQSLAAIKKAGLFSLSEMAEIVHARQRTLNAWLYSGVTPCERVRSSALAALQSPSLPPSVRMRWKMENEHGLTFDRTKRRWKFRFTIADKDPKKVGKRICIHIPTTEAATAIAIKKMFLSVLSQSGLTVRPRIQKRRSM